MRLVGLYSIVAIPEIIKLVGFYVYFRSFKLI